VKVINLETLRWSLTELASREEQEQLWLGLSKDEMSSFEEATCGVFDDAGLTRAVDSGYLRRKFSEEINNKVASLSRLVAELPRNVHPREVINHPKMEDVRKLAQELLSLFDAEGGGAGDTS
jgi:hypothetical protein